MRAAAFVAGPSGAPHRARSGAQPNGLPTRLSTATAANSSVR